MPSVWRCLSALASIKLFSLAAPAGRGVHGVVTGVGGGIIRDVLAREIPMILRTEIYATACIVGGIVHATAHDTFHLPLENSAMMGMVVTVIRLAAIRWHLKLPTFAPTITVGNSKTVTLRLPFLGLPLPLGRTRFKR